jgi:hypothetical protein
MLTSMEVIPSFEVVKQKLLVDYLIIVYKPAKLAKI